MLEYHSAIVKYSEREPRILIELSTILYNKVPRKKIAGNHKENIYMVRMQIIATNNTDTLKPGIEWEDGYNTYIHLINKIKNQ